MGKSHADVLRLLGEIYAAGLGETDWYTALRSVSRFFGGAGATVFDHNRATGAVPVLYVTNGIDAGRGEYVDRMHAISPRTRYAFARRGCFTFCDYDVLPEAAMRRHEFYDWLGRECGLKYHVGARMIDDGDVSSCISIEFAPEHGHVQRSDIELFERVIPHIANAWRMSRRLAQAACIDDFNVMLLENSPWGVVTLDHRGHVLSINGVARGAIGRGDGLCIEGGKLRALRAADDRSMQATIGQALRAAQGEGFHAGGSMVIGRSGATIPYGLRVMPARQVIGLVPDGIPFVTIFITDPCLQVAPGTDDLTELFGLSQREGEVALGIAQGESVAELAEHMGISRNTVRTHLANAMAKTGTRSQSALTGLIRGLPPAGLR